MNEIDRILLLEIKDVERKRGIKQSQKSGWGKVKIKRDSCSLSYGESGTACCSSKEAFSKDLVFFIRTGEGWLNYSGNIPLRHWGFSFRPSQ